MTNLNLNNNSGSANSPTYVNTSVPERGHAEVMNLTSTASPTSVVEVESEEHEDEEESIYYEGPEFAHSNDLYAVPNRGESQFYFDPTELDLIISPRLRNSIFCTVPNAKMVKKAYSYETQVLLRNRKLGRNFPPRCMIDGEGC